MSWLRHTWLLILLVPLLAFQPVEQSAPLKVLTWNVFLRPHSLFKDGQRKRAEAIAEVLLQENYDVIALQEVFDKTRRMTLIDRLGDQYPHFAGPSDRGLLKINDGLMIFSKYPIVDEEIMRYSRAAGADRMARKGALLVELTVNGKAVQVVNTHAQSMSDRKCQRIRNSQYQELQEDLLARHSRTGVPQIILGDMNTDRADSASYAEMLNTFDALDGKLSSDLKISCNSPENDLYESSEEHRPKLIDFVLLRRNKAQLHIKQRKVRLFCKRWSEEHKTLSDHHAIEALIVMD
jgi:endonuclease/exonuclease/phosphatase family metal-dependent hydrolase